MYKRQGLSKVQGTQVMYDEKKPDKDSKDFAQICLEEVTKSCGSCLLYTSDYVQYYKKNHDLSPEAKEKLKNALWKAKNNYREVFVKDCLLYTSRCV